MAKLKTRKHSAICPDCNGNGYVQFHIEEGREHVTRKEKYMWMSPKLLSFILMMILLQVMLTNCTKLEFDGFDPTTSALKWIMTKDKNGTQ